MADWWPLTDLACRPPDDRRLLAWRGADGITHAGFMGLVDAWQAAFASRPAVSQWAIYLEDPVSFAAALLAAWHLGKVVVLPGDDRAATLQALRGEGCALAGDLPGGLLPMVPAGDELCGQRSVINPSDARLKVYTSGSQGQPEAIDKTFAQLISEIEALEASFGGLLSAADRGPTPLTVWATVSHQHIYGLLFLVLWPLAAGRPLAARRLQYPEDLAACLGPEPSVLVATPAHLKRLGDQLDWSAARQGLRAVFSSGGPLPFEVSRSVDATLGHTPIEVFGSSETGGIAWRQSEFDQTPWQPFADVQWRVEEGCLAVRSPRLPDAQQWWRTSDRVEAADGENFRLLGRADRIVKIEEKRVSLSAVEQHAVRTAWIKEARALVIETPVGARVAVVAVPTDAGRAHLTQGRRVLADALRQALLEVLEPMACPKRWRFVDALPVNAQGKTPESMLKDLFDAPAPVAGPSPEMPTVAWLERSDSSALAALDIHAGLQVFDGHFPGAPILPGVAQLDWAMVLGRQCFDLPERFVRLEALKFMRPVLPGTRLLMALEFKRKDADVSVLTFKLYSQSPSADQPTDHASGRAVWARQTEAPHV